MDRVFKDHVTGREFKTLTDADSWCCAIRACGCSPGCLGVAWAADDEVLLPACEGPIIFALAR